MLNCLAGMPLLAGTARDQPFDAAWSFLRGDAPGAEAAAFDDARWRTLDVPHDWSIEDLPPAEAIPELAAVTGRWRFHRGDDAGWSKRDVDDNTWEVVTLPDNWEHHSGYTGDNVYGWFRRRIAIPEACRGRDFDLLLGQIDDVDEVWLNGERLGGTGSFPPDYRTAWNLERRYRVPARRVRGDGSDLLAIRVFDGTGNGGLLSEGVPAARVGPFDPRQSAGANATGHAVGGTAWYRKHFVVREAGKRVAVRFDGVYMNAELWLNGRRLGEHPHGYTAFEFDLTPYLKPPGQDNVLAVKVRNEGRNSRWYSGSGIYRHAWLTIREPVHVPTWGVFVTTPEVANERAVVKVTVEIRNTTNATTTAVSRVRLRGPAGMVVNGPDAETALGAGETRVAEHRFEVPAPALWSAGTPSLHVAEAEIAVGGRTVDVARTSFGIRKIEVDAQRGFRLNGESIELKGCCLHHDNGPLGAAAIDRAEERRVELMKANGFNAIRTSHNPPSTAFLEACDRLGMLVIDEAFDQWNEAKIGNNEDYHRFFKDWHARDIASMVRRDRNHPSVVMWSIGNEIPEQFRAEETARVLREAVLAHDPTRPVTAAICSDWGNVSRNWDTRSDPAFRHLDVAGYNYLPDKYEGDHRRHPERVMVGAESYPKDLFDYWSLVERHPYVIGDFVWTGMDYLGEAGIGHAVLDDQQASFFMSWPWFNAWCGDLDLCGFKKPQSFYRDVVWNRSRIEMMVHDPIPPGRTEKVSGWGWPLESQRWNWPGHEGEPLRVAVYTRAEKVRLELNGKTIGEQDVSALTKLCARFDVPYAPGELRAIAIAQGRELGRTTLATTGPPRKLRLTPDRPRIRADRSDLSFVTVEVVDAQGRRVPDAVDVVRFTVSGPGELAAQGSGSPNDPASFRAPARKCFQGRCLAVVRPRGNDAGTIVLRAEADGLEPASATVLAE